MARGGPRACLQRPGSRSGRVGGVDDGGEAPRRRTGRRWIVKRVLWVGVACWASVLAAGCAGYTIQKDGQGVGYDVYAPTPYLLRKPHYNGTVLNGFDFEVVMLPDRTQRYRVHSWAGLSKANFT